MRCLAATPWVIDGELFQLDCTLEHGHRRTHQVSPEVAEELRERLAKVEVAP